VAGLWLCTADLNAPLWLVRLLRLTSLNIAQTISSTARPMTAYGLRCIRRLTLPDMVQKNVSRYY